jgi:hypothetical protein
MIRRQKSEWLREKGEGMACLWHTAGMADIYGEFSMCPILLNTFLYMI